MICNVKYNNEGKIIKVLDTNGQESLLFNSIAKIPHVENLEQALEIYKNSIDDSLGNQSIQYNSDKGNSFNTFKEALKDSDSGDIAVNINGRELISLSSNTNKKTPGGLINYLIKNEILSDSKIVENGETFYKAEGYDQVKQVVNEQIIVEEAPKTIISKDGKVSFYKEQERPQQTNETLQKINEAVKSVQPKPFGQPQAILSEEALKSRLLEFLKSIGVEVTNFENYIEKYKIKNGVEPSAEALADISNQVVAFREGILDISLLTEETAHFIVEGWNNEQEINDLLLNIHKTASYQEFGEKYREIYRNENSNLSEQELDTLVRKEILGKELANAIQKRFNPETEIEASIFQKLYNSLVNFFNKVILKDNYNEQFNSILNKVEDILLAKDINYINTAQYKTKKFKLYNISNTDTATQAQRNLIKSLIEQEKSLRKSGKGSTSSINKLESMLNQALAKKSVQDLVVLAKRQINYVKEAVSTANKKNTTLSLEENMVYQNLTNVISPALSQMKVSLNNNPDYKKETKDIDKLVSDISDSKALLKISENNVLDKIVDRLMKRGGFEDGYIKIKDANGELVEMDVREHLLNSIKTAQKDTNAVYSYFGQITHAQDPLLNIMGNVIGDMYTDASQDYMNRVKTYQKGLRDLGFTEQDVTKLTQNDGYITSKWDFVEFEDFLKYSKASAYKNNLENIVISTQERVNAGEKIEKELEEHKSFLGLNEQDFLNKFEGIPVITDEKLLNKVKTEAQSTINKGSETVLSQEYLEKQEKLYEDLNINEATKIKLKGFSEIRGQIKRSAVKSKSGVNIYTLQNKYDLEFLNIERRKASSIFDEDGTPKKGIIQSETPINSDSVKVANDLYINITSNASEEAIISYDMNKLTQNFIEEKNKSGDTFNEKLDESTHSKWFADLNSMEQDEDVTREDIINWFNLNTQVGFSKEFFAKNEKEDLFQSFENDENINSNIETYKELLKKRRALINQYKDPNNGVNTLAESMTPDTRKEIITLSEDIDNESSRIFMYIKGKNKNSNLEEREVTAETKANEAYFGALKDNNLSTFQEQFDFTTENMTASNRRKVQQYRQAVEEGVIPSTLSQIAEKYGTSEEGILEYAQSKLAPYYKSFAPIALQEFYDDLRNDTSKSVSSLIEKLNSSEDVRISVSYDYLDTNDSDILNNNRDKDFKGGWQQPSLINTPTVLGRTFNFNNENWSEIANNEKLKALHEYHINFQNESLKSFGVDGTHNVYLAPQVSKSRVEKLDDLVRGNNKKATINEWLQELRNYRVDELVQGEEVDGKSLYNSGIRVIPKYYLNKLEKVTDVSTDLFYSTMLMAQQAELYKNRREKYAELATIEDGFLNRAYPEGKSAESTNTYKMAKSQLDYALFGVQETKRLRVNLPIVGQRDLTKTISTVRRWKQNLSLALNPIVPLTSMFTAQTQLFMERLVGQYIDGNSYDKARKEFRKLAVDGFNESLEINSKAKVSILGEYFGIYNLDNRFQNSKYNKYVRSLGKAMYGLHTAGNYVPLTQGMLSVLYGNRVYKNRILDFNQYKSLKNGEGVDIKSIEQSWKNEKSIYDYIEVKDGKVTYDESLYTDLKVESQEEFRNLELGLIAKGKKIVERIDGQIKPEERTALQRHFLLSFIGTHKGWLMIATANRFKGQHLNLQTGQLEEGSYVSAGKYFSRVIENFAKLDVTALKSAYKQASPIEKQNLIRVVKELGVLSAVYTLGMFLVGYADDDDNKDSYGLQASAYLTDRLINETSSAQLGVIGELYNTIKQPVVGLQQVTNALKVHELVTGNKEITRGRYAGLSERERYVLRTLVGAKVAYDLSSAKNLKSQRDSYEFFNKDAEYYNPIAYILAKEDFEQGDDE